jgi:hypothetical protein
MRQPGAPPSCDLCGWTTNVGQVKHREMVANTPYVRDLCSRCAKTAALVYYSRGGKIEPPAPTHDVDPDTTGASRDW